MTKGEEVDVEDQSEAERGDSWKAAADSRNRRGMTPSERAQPA